jgi:glycosyltransferase involved in cell wall biosynthesis
VHLLVVGKSAYSRVIGGKPVPITIAGHTAQFMRPLMSYALAHGMTVSYAYPLQPSGCLMFDPLDAVPDGAVEVPFTDVSAAKAPLHLGWLSLEASLRQAVEAQGDIDWVFLPYAFPLAPLLAGLKEKYGFQLAVFLRGGDGYQWLDPRWAADTIGDPGQARQICDLYRESLQAADFVGVASQWLGSVVEQYGVRYHAVVESPAAMWPGPGPEPSWDKERFSTDPSVVRHHGSLDVSKKWVLSAGRIHPDKHLDLAADAFCAARLDGWQLVLSGAGAGPGPVAGGLVAELAAKGEACVIEVPPRIIHGLFQVSDAYLQTSLPSATFVDARPSSVTSAAFHGKPVVVPIAAAGGVTESVAPENLQTYGFDVRDLNPEDPADRAEIVRRATAALRLLDDPALRIRAGAANTRHASASSVDAVFGRVWAGLGGR